MGQKKKGENGGKTEEKNKNRPKGEKKRSFFACKDELGRGLGCPSTLGTRSDTKQKNNRRHRTEPYNFLLLMNSLVHEIISRNLELHGWYSD